MAPLDRKMVSTLAEFVDPRCQFGIYSMYVWVAFFVACTNADEIALQHKGGITVDVHDLMFVYGCMFCLLVCLLLVCSFVCLFFCCLLFIYLHAKLSRKSSHLWLLGVFVAFCSCP